MKPFAIFGLIFCVVVVALPAIGFAEAKTPAGTIIRNQAVIEFQSLAGEQFQASSNEVLMVVQPVYGIEILPDGTQPAPGQTYTGVADQEMIFPYTLTFTGNVKDTATITPTFDDANSTFLPQTPDGVTGFYIYNDLDFNGMIDPDDVTVAQWLDKNADGDVDAADEIVSFGLGKSYDPDGIANLLVRFIVPSSAIAGNAAYFGIDGVSNGDGTVTDVGNISQAVIVDDASIRIRKSAIPDQTVNVGGTVAYTVSAENNGTNSANARDYDVDGGTDNYSGVLLHDVIPADQDTGNPLTLAAPAPIGTISTAGATGTILYSDQSPVTGDPTTWTWQTAPPASPTVVAFISSDGANDYDLPNGEEMTLTFTVDAPSTEQTFPNQGVIHYEDNAGPAAQDVESNIVYITTTVVANPGVDLRDTDFEAPPPPKTPADDGGGATNDTQSINDAQAGTAVYFTNRVENTGTIEDTFNITLSVPAAATADDWRVVVLKSDGVTPLGDTGFDNIPDTGIMDPGETRDIVIRVHIPSDPAVTAADIVVTATSTADGTVSDPTTDRIGPVTAVTPATMNLANHVVPPAGTPDENTIQKTGNAGEYVDFPLIVQNTAPADAAHDTYLMDTVDLPAGWVAVFYPDENDNGVLDDSELIPTLETGAVGPAGYAPLIARIFIPGGANYDSDTVTPGVQPYDITFKATSTNNGASDSILDEVMVNPSDSFELRPDRNGTIEPGGATFYTHEIQNYGSRPNRFYLDIGPGTPYWNYILYDETASAQLPQDGGRYYVDLDAAGGANDRETFQIKLFAPTNTPVGHRDVSTITATARDFGIAETSSIVDVTQVVKGDLVLRKSSNPPDGTKVSPGDTIEYKTVFFNKGTEPINTLIIYDQIPAYTEYILQSGAAAPAPVLPAGITGVTFQVSRNGGISWTDDTAGSGADPTVTNIRAVMTGQLRAGAEGSVTFTIQVK